MQFKVVLIGDAATGKTTLVRRIQYGVFQPGARTTVGVEFAQRALVVDGSNITVRLFDIAGQESTRAGSRAYYQGAVGAFVVVDASNPQSIDSSLRWKRDLDEKTTNSRFCQQTHMCSSREVTSAAAAASSTSAAPFNGAFTKVLPCYLLLNKCDLGVQCGLSKAQLQMLCQKHGFAGYFETSSVNGTNIEQALDALVRAMQEATEKAERDPPPPPPPGITPHTLRGKKEDGMCSNC